MQSPFLPHIDALGPGRRLAGVSDALLDDRPDPTLQRIVEEAAKAVGAPIALVSLVLDNIQLFRAQVGLPDDLARTRATARDVSFCQMAVRDDALFEVEDATARPDLPQALVRSHGIRAYLGAPIHLDGQPLGSLCVIDVRPRTFSAEQRAQLVGLAAEVDARLARWSARVEDARRARAITAPVLADMRNRLTVLACARDELRIVRAELMAEQRFAESGQGDLSAIVALRRLRSRTTQVSEVLQMLDRSGDRLLADLEQLEAVAARGIDIAGVDRVVALVRETDRTSAASIGGVRWHVDGTGQDIARPAANAALLLGAVIERVVGEAPRSYTDGLDVIVSERPGQIVFQLSGPPLPNARVMQAWQGLVAGPLDTASATFEVDADRVQLSLSAVPRAPSD